jgi:catecholate siderophore receptor
MTAEQKNCTNPVVALYSQFLSICKRPVYAALLITSLLCQLQAEPAKVTVTGTVVDASGARVAGARVTALREGATLSTSVRSNERGEFSFPVEPGSYNLKVAADGFVEASQPLDFKDVAPGPLEIVLKVSGNDNMVTITEPSGYQVATISSATKTPTLLLNTPQSVSIVTQELIKDQSMRSIADVVRYIPGVSAHQGENNRDQVIIRGNSSSADFFVNGVRDDVQYYRDLYNVERVEALKGPNAMMFGRGGGGGVINRVTKEALDTPLHEFSLQGGSFGNKRFATDLDQPFGDRVAFRLNGVYENSDSFRNAVNLERYGFNPTMKITAGSQTEIKLSYEHFRDYRVADRGIPSYLGRPADTDISTYFGNPDVSPVRAVVNLGTAAIEHQEGGLNIRNRTMFGDYDRGYQNFVPGAVNAAKTLVALTAYNNATARRNIFNQTDLTYGLRTGWIRHTLLGGAEFGRQLTDNFRNTGFFNNTATSVSVSYANPTITTPVTFRQSATDANNHLTTNIAATYVQDQVELSRYVQVIAGVRFDRFDLTYLNNRNGDNLNRVDNLVSPRAGIVFKPVDRVSIYGNYSISYLPSSGDQFSSLTTITQQVKPEQFTNYEVGVKWNVNNYLSLTTAVYRLNRTNTRSVDPNDPTRIVQTGSQRTNGFEAGVNGRITRAWQMVGGYAYQDAFITSATASAIKGAQVGQVPHHTFSLWNNYRIVRRWGAGLGIVRQTDMFAAIDNTVKLPGFTRVDAATYVSLTEKINLQANLENMFNRKYYAYADGNNNISPGSPRAVRVGMTFRF